MLNGVPWGSGCVHSLHDGCNAFLTKKDGLSHGFEYAYSPGHYAQTEFRDDELSGLKTSHHIDENIVNLKFEDGEEVHGENVTSTPDKMYFLPMLDLEIVLWKAGTRVRTTL